MTRMRTHQTPLTDEPATSRMRSGTSITLGAAAAASAPAWAVTGSLLLGALAAVVALVCVAGATVMI
ncbi:hypothetical protein [Rhodococcus sp. T7]|uniref:hypothetical protein n=1 Tax=Rhodococcus sp. T7 TaxID=627444 RepID=UPI0013596827|nr:hypothetical protein [Rhodococcus sp. T7]KAF0957396.1 hypothetical protein MLGJGCBP_09228 [Rhodococcus sp. T7]KAF0962133.1 hypothetical protein MLGJGCBP_04754 [Rhodococcus sp. T7]